MVAFVEFPCAASRTASCAKNWPAVFPYAPNVSTTSGTHFQPSWEQIGSLHVCFLWLGLPLTPEGGVSKLWMHAMQLPANFGEM